jgi:hypothetical protein
MGLVKREKEKRERERIFFIMQYTTFVPSQMICFGELAHVKRNHVTMNFHDDVAALILIVNANSPPFFKANEHIKEHRHGRLLHGYVLKCTHTHNKSVNCIWMRSAFGHTCICKYARHTCLSCMTRMSSHLQCT